MPSIEEIRTALGTMDDSFGNPSRESPNINENVISNPFSTKLFAPVEQLESEIQDRDKIIESLKKESIELKNQVYIVEEEKVAILKELEKSRWFESKVAKATKKVYEDKVKSVINVNVDSKIIPVLTAVAKRKQGNQQLNWGNWLKIPENRYLFQVNEDIARKVFEDTNALIGKRSRGSGVSTTIVYGLQFDGADDHIATEFANGETQTDRTYSFWMNATLTTKNQAVFGYGTNKKEAFTPNFSSNRPLLWGGANWYTFFDDNSAQDDGQWHHWMIFNDVSDTEGMKMYVDGVQLDFNSDRSSGTPGVHTQGLTIGGSKHDTTANQHAECSLTNFAVFSGDKTDDASAHYNNGIPKNLTNESDLQGYWKMDEGSGSTVKDHSGNGNTGTIENGAVWLTAMEIDTVGNKV